MLKDKGLPSEATNGHLIRQLKPCRPKIGIAGM